MAVAFVLSVPCGLSKSSFTTSPVARSELRKKGQFALERRRPRISCCIEAPDWKRGPIDIDYERDEKLQVLEQDLDEALAHEEFGRAAKLRDDLLRLQSGAYVAVLSANFKYYKAFEKASLVDMAGVWLQDRSVTCKHPLGPVMIGYAEAINSYGYLFAMGIPRMEVKNVSIIMRGSAAWVTCEEHSMTLGDDKEIEAAGNELYEARSEKGAYPIRLDATHIFVKRNSQWYLAHRSVQPVYSVKA